jgi:hypothetical protein
MAVSAGGPPPLGGRPSRRYYVILLVSAVLIASVLLTASWAATAYTAKVQPFPPTPPIATGPSGVRVSIVSIEAEFEYWNRTLAPVPLNITGGLAGAPPYEFPSGELLNWTAQPVNTDPNADYLYTIGIGSPGFVWNGPDFYTTAVFPANGSLLLNLTFTLPYGNYTGPLVFQFSL